MRAGDLVTLSAYATSTDGLRPWADWRRKSDGKPPLVGIIVRVSTLDESDPKYRYYSKNERTRFYISWPARDAPISRYGKYNMYGVDPDCFYRNDLKYMREQEKK
jgi:hypothetical protein